MEDHNGAIGREVRKLVKPILDQKNEVVQDLLKTFLILAATSLSILVSLHKDGVGCDLLFKSIAVSLSLCIITGFLSFGSYISLINRHMDTTVKNYFEDMHGGKIKDFTGPKWYENFYFLIFKLSFFISIVLLAMYALSM